MARDEIPAGEDLLATFARWAAADRASRAAASRTHERLLREQAAAEATWLGVLLDLAESGAAVTLAVGSDRVQARLLGVGEGFLAVQLRSGRPALVRTGKVSAVWPSEGGGTSAEPGGSRFPALGLSLSAAFAGLAGERAPVHLHLSGGQEVSGELVSAGADLLTLRGEPPSRRVVHVAVADLAICELA